MGAGPWLTPVNRVERPGRRCGHHVGSPSKRPSQKVPIQLQRQRLLPLLQPAPGGRRQHHRRAGPVRADRGRLLVEGVDRPDRVAGAVLAAARAGGVVDGGASGTSAAAGLRSACPGPRGPPPEAYRRGLNQLPSSSTRSSNWIPPLQLAVQVRGGALQDRGAVLVDPACTRLPRVDHDLLALLDGAVGVRRDPQRGKLRGTKAALQTGSHLLRRPAQNHRHADGVRRLQEPREHVHRRKVESRDVREVQHQADGARGGAERLLELVGERVHASEEDVAAQPPPQRAPRPPPPE